MRINVESKHSIGDKIYLVNEEPLFNRPLDDDFIWVVEEYEITKIIAEVTNSSAEIWYAVKDENTCEEDEYTFSVREDVIFTDKNEAVRDRDIRTERDGETHKIKYE